MSRINDRRNAFYLIFQMEFFDIEERDKTKEIFFSVTEGIDESDKDFILSLVEGTMENLEKIDDIISKASKGWAIDRISKVDLAILRMGVFEVTFFNETPASVAINEAVELAKRYSSDEAPAFVNGILGTLIDK